MVDTAKAGRNDACPCGSGKKYKRCCLAPAVAAEFTWQRLRRAEGHVIDTALEFATRHYSPDAVVYAWDQFSFGAEGIPADDPLFESSFIPWLTFNWIPDPGLDIGHAPPAGAPLALQALQAHPDRFDEFEARFARAMSRCPYSFYTVTAVAPGRSLTLKDIMTHREYEVFERGASTMVRRGGILFTRLLEMDGVAIMCGCAPLIIPAQEHLWLIDVRYALTRKRAPMPEEALHTHAEALRAAYFDIADRFYHPQLPTLCNTDGDPLLLQTLHFDLHCTPRAAFDRLRSLSLDQSDECMEEAKYDAHGALRAVRLSWVKRGNAQHKGWDNTVLGGLRIDGAKLTLHVNSQRRAEAGRAEVERRLGADAVYRTTVVESVEKALQERRDRPETARERRAREANERLNALPEVQAHLRALAAEHWKAWLDEKIPALRNRTPRQASRTAEGRERLEALLQSFEAYDAAHGASPFAADVAMLRKELGLSR